MKKKKSNGANGANFVSERSVPGLEKNQFINKNFPNPDQQFTGKGFRDIKSSSDSQSTSDVLDEKEKEKKDE